MKKPVDIPEAAVPFLASLSTVFQEMDAAYDVVADRMGFQCNGCEDNCCETRFYHHTYIEFYYMVKGLSAFSEEELARIADSAAAVAKQQSGDTPQRVMCPVNRNGMCLIYEWRPMVCRLHGIPHELRPPGRDILRSPGCGHFDDVKSMAVDSFLDRTPHYAALAGLERELRGALALTAGRRETVAEMVLSALGISLGAENGEK